MEFSGDALWGFGTRAPTFHMQRSDVAPEIRKQSLHSHVLHWRWSTTGRTRWKIDADAVVCSRRRRRFILRRGSRVRRLGEVLFSHCDARYTLHGVEAGKEAPRRMFRWYAVLEYVVSSVSPALPL